jgi:hypothetical protein
MLATTNRIQFVRVTNISIRCSISNLVMSDCLLKFPYFFYSQRDVSETRGNAEC